MTSAVLPRMSFLKPLRDFLNEKGVIYTVWAYRYPYRTVYVNGVGECKLEYVMSVTNLFDLMPYIGLSGFESVDDWWKKVREFVPSSQAPIWLWRVTKK